MNYRRQALSLCLDPVQSSKHSILKCYTKRVQKGKPFLKKSGGILCKGNRLETYRFIENHYKQFGLRWLLRRLAICPNAYYNNLKHRKALESQPTVKEGLILHSTKK